MSRTYPDRPIVAVGAAVCRGEQVLVVQRAREPSRGVWTVPGGVVDLGEEMAQAAAREVREECGIAVEVGAVVGVIDNIVRDADGAVRYHYAIIDYAARYLSGELAPNDELAGAAWITPAQFDTYRISPRVRPILLAALREGAPTQGSADR
ncbi:MAG: NUDIX hydrolase [Anaerolineae bacterium]|nr:NUDIX hydrolase [Anaerolineae bacterium]